MQNLHTIEVSGISNSPKPSPGLFEVYFLSILPHMEPAGESEFPKIPLDW